MQVMGGNFTQLAFDLGAGEWSPTPFTYTNGFNAVCNEQVPSTNCNPRKWNPAVAEPILSERWCRQHAPVTCTVLGEPVVWRLALSFSLSGSL